MNFFSLSLNSVRVCFSSSRSEMRRLSKRSCRRRLPSWYMMLSGIVSPPGCWLLIHLAVMLARDDGLGRASHRDPSNLVMITHDLNISDVVLEDTVSMGEFFVVQPNGTNFDVIGKIELNKEH